MSYVWVYVRNDCKNVGTFSAYHQVVCDLDCHPLNKYTKKFENTNTEAINQYKTELETLILIGAINNEQTSN